MSLNSDNLQDVFTSFIDGPYQRSTRELDYFSDLCETLFLLSAVRHNDLQTLVDFTELLYSTRNESDRCTSELRPIFVQKLQILSCQNPGPSSCHFPFFRFLYFCFTQFLCTRREIVNIIQLFVSENPGLHSQICFISSWFLDDIERHNPQLFEKITALLKTTNFLDSSVPIAHNFSGLQNLRDRIYSVFEPNSLGDAIRTDDVSSLSHLAREANFDFSTTIPPPFFGCYLLWGDSNPTLIEAAAFFGSTTVFKYLVLNGSLPEEGDPQISVIRWAFAGANFEIIRFLVQRDFPISAGLPIAIYYHQYSLLSWLSNRYFPSLVKGRLDELDPNLQNVLRIAAARSSNMRFLVRYQIPPRELMLLLKTAASLGQIFAFEILISNENFPKILAENHSVLEDLSKWILDGGSLPILKAFIHAKFPLEPNSLIRVCNDGRLDMLQFLIPHYFKDVNISGPNSMTPLIAASERGHAFIAEFLLANGALTNPICSTQRAAFDCALLGGHIETIRVFLKEKVLPYSVLPPVKIGIMRKHIEVVRLLLDDDRVEIDLETVVDAAETGFTEGIRALLDKLQKSEIRTFCQNDMAPLHHAVLSREPSAVEVFLKADGTIVNYADRKLCVPLHYAALIGADGICELLLECEGIEVNAKDAFGQTPLHMAAENGNVKCIELLLGHPDIDANVKDNERRTSLQLAVLYNKSEVVKQLLGSEKVRINGRNSRGFNGLHTACDEGFFEIVRQLVRSPRIKLCKTTTQGWTVLHFAAARGYEDVFWFLIPKCKEILNARTVAGFTALHLACMGKFLEIVRVLIEQEEIDGNLQTERESGGKSCLHFAANLGFVKGVKLLLESGKVDANIRAADGSLAVDLARRYDRRGVVKVLEEWAATRGN